MSGKETMNGKETWTDEVRAEMEDTEDWTDDEGEVRELGDADFARMRPISELAPELQEMLRGLRAGSFVARTADETVDVPVSRSVVERFRVSGSGWEQRVDEALRDWLDRQQAS